MNLNPFYESLEIIQKARPNGKIKLIVEFDELLKTFVPKLEYVNKLKSKRFLMRFTRYDSIKPKDVAEAFITNLKEKSNG